MITVKYSCAKCGIEDRDVIVPDRQPGQDVVVYMQQVVAACIQEDHLREFPNCTATSITNLKIPIKQGSRGIGIPPGESS